MHLMQNQQNFLIAKTFIFQCQRTHSTDNLEISLPSDSLPSLRYIINIWKHKNNIKTSLLFKIYDTTFNRYMDLDLDSESNDRFFYSNVVMIKWREEVEGEKVGRSEDEGKSINSKRDSELCKRQRNKQRSIEQVLKSVKQWRSLHNTINQNKMKINLQEAAKIVGISKKSLDDYYCQLRLAQEYGFDFHTNIHDNIGVLRTFVKERRIKDEKGIKHERLPKNLRILGEIDIGKRDMILQKSKIQQKLSNRHQSQQKQQKEQQQQTVLEAQYEPPLATIQEDQYENRFFSSFDFKFNVNEPEDPFVTLGRKNVEKELFSDSDDLLF